MVRCSAYGCKSGYDSSRPAKSENISFFSYPRKNQELCDKWVKANPRQDFKVTNSSKLCSLHFHDSDFVEERRDSNNSRKHKKAACLNTNKPLRRYLKPDVVPSIFRNAPSYLSKSSSKRKRKTSKATTESRFNNDQRRLDERQVSLNASEDLTDLTLEQLLEKLYAECNLPTGFTMTVMDETLVIYMLHLTTGIPTVTASIAVDSDLTVTVQLQGNAVPVSQYTDLVTGKVNQLSQLINLMARLKSWIIQPTMQTLEFRVQMAASILEGALELIDSCENGQDDDVKKLQFLIEQLRLLNDARCLLTQRFFNCVAKNITKGLTQNANLKVRDSKKRKRKVDKLSSTNRH